MNQWKWLILLILMLFSITASAEFYKFIDEEGNVQFTDDLTKVPVNQREGVNKYIESRTDAEDMQDNAQKEKEQNLPGDEEKEATQNVYTDLLKEKERLETKKKELDEEYDSLVKEKEEIDKRIKKLKTNEEIKKSNERVKLFNEKIKIYEEKRRAYNAEVEAYNAKVAK